MCLAMPGQIVCFRDPERLLADVEEAGVRRVVNVGLVSAGPDAAQIGDWILIHAGVALSKVSEEEALATNRLLEELAD
jgi:hydrogenase expression/formation protein HypC